MEQELGQLQNPNEVLFRRADSILNFFKNDPRINRTEEMGLPTEEWAQILLDAARVAKGERKRFCLLFLEKVALFTKENFEDMLARIGTNSEEITRMTEQAFNPFVGLSDSIKKGLDKFRKGEKG